MAGFMGCQTSNFMLIEENITMRGGKGAADHVKKRRLARAIRADKPQDLPFVLFKSHRFYGR